MFNKKAFIEAIKEPLRLLLLAIIPFALAYFETINYQWAAIITVILRFVDKILYEAGKQGDNPALSKGLTGF